jgi:hypothetical protein
MLVGVFPTSHFIIFFEKNMMMSRHDPTETTISELQAAGIEPTTIKVGGKGHYKVYFNLCGKSRFIVCANTPSDWRSERNSRSLVRRIIKRKGQLNG